MRSKITSLYSFIRSGFRFSGAGIMAANRAACSRVIWEACGRDPEELILKHLPSFEVDVQRRWPSVEKARRELGWEAAIDVPEGVAQTVDWLRSRRAEVAS